MQMSSLLSVLQPEGMAGPVIKGGYGARLPPSPIHYLVSNSSKGSAVRCESDFSHLGSFAFPVDGGKPGRGRYSFLLIQMEQKGPTLLQESRQL